MGIQFKHIDGAVTKGQQRLRFFSLLFRHSVHIVSLSLIGKTHVARAVADACEANLIVVQSADVLNSKLGASEKSIDRLFQLAHKFKPSVVVIENIEVLCPKESAVGIPLSVKEYKEETKAMEQRKLECDGKALNEAALLLLLINEGHTRELAVTILTTHWLHVL